MTSVLLVRHADIELLSHSDDLPLAVSGAEALAHAVVPDHPRAAGAVRWAG